MGLTGTWCSKGCVIATLDLAWLRERGEVEEEQEPTDRPSDVSVRDKRVEAEDSEGRRERIRRREQN